MSCAMVYWGDDFERFREVFVPFGAVVDVRNCRDNSPVLTEQLSLEMHPS